METLILWVLMAGGLQKIEEPITALECVMVLAMGRAAADADAALMRDEGEVVRLACGGRDVVIALPMSAGPCDWSGA